MSKVKFGKWTFTEKELERQFAEATERGAEAERTELRADDVSYDRKANRLVIHLVDDTIISISTKKIQGLADASAEDIAQVELTPLGNALHWERLDVDFSVPGLVAGILGTRAWMAELGRKGGSSSSEAKGAAARENGRKGGRPSKSKVVVAAQPIEVVMVKGQNVSAPGIIPVVWDTTHLSTTDLVTVETQLCLDQSTALAGHDLLVSVEGWPIPHPEPIIPTSKLIVGNRMIGNLLGDEVRRAANSAELALAA